MNYYCNNYYEVDIYLFFLSILILYFDMFREKLQVVFLLMYVGKNKKIVFFKNKVKIIFKSV